jgi:hypothetical protein
MTNNAATTECPEMKRRWDVTVFRNDPVDGGIKNVLVEHFENVRSTWITGNVVSYDGVLHFVDGNGKEVVVASLPFIVKEVAPAP